MSQFDYALKDLSITENLLLIQDIDGVCIPLVKNPLDRVIDPSYILAASKFKDEFAVLTNGEHEGKRGVNRVIERSLKNKKVSELGLYLPGLAAGGIEYQDKYGNTNHTGIKEEEIQFLSKLPNLMEKLLKEYSAQIITNKSKVELDYIVQLSVLDTIYSPTINLNGFFEIIREDIYKQRELQDMLLKLMLVLINKAESEGLDNSFYLHIAPNLGGSKKGLENDIKYAQINDIGTTDIQFMLNGAKKEYGLIVLINKYIEKKKGYAPLGKDFNVRNCPKDILSQIKLCKDHILEEDMPLLVGVGDTVTSTYSKTVSGFLRGGSDRGFLTLIQELGKAYKKDNKVFLVDSSGGEVQRPSLKNNNTIGITDSEDTLKFDLIFQDGPPQYISFFKDLANLRSITY